MKVSQQIVGVNQRLGNSAVPNMQGTTRVIFDSIQQTSAATDFSLTFFAGVSSRQYPRTNLNTNRFEVGESLAIQGFTLFTAAEIPTANSATLSSFDDSLNSGLLNFYIGNQRILKDVEIVKYGQFAVGEAGMVQTAQMPCVFRLETPIVIPPQIEFYATIRFGATATYNNVLFYLSAYGQGTLLNTKSTF